MAVQWAQTACHAAHTQDAFVLFQSFQAILDNLPTLPLFNPSTSIASLSTLRDFLLAVILARSALDKMKPPRAAKTSNSSALSWSESRSTTWPKYTQARAYQAFAAVQKRLMGLHIEAENQRGDAVREAINQHTTYIFGHLASLLSLPSEWPTEESSFLVAQSNVVVGVGVVNALLGETCTTFARLVTEGNTKGKAKSVDFSGLLPLQHRWCKAVVQTYALPSLLDRTMQALHATMPGQPHAHQTFLFPLLVSLAQRLVGWVFVVDEPFAGLEGPISVERQTQLLEQDDHGAEDGGGDDDTDEGPSITRADKPLSRSLPSSHSSFFSTEVVSLLHLAYQHSLSLEKMRQPEAFYCVPELRRCILDVASYRLALHSDSDRLTVRQSKQSQLNGIANLIAQECNGQEAVPSNGVHGGSLLFLSQLLFCFVASDRETLMDSIDLPHLAESLTLLTNTVFRFAFTPREDSDEEDDLVQQGDEAVDNVLSAWRVLLPRSFQDGKDALASQQIKGVVFSSVVCPYIELRLLSAGAGADSGNDEHSEFGQEVQADGERYEEQLVTFAGIARETDLPACLRYLLEACNPILQELQYFYAADHQASAEEERRIESIWEQAHWVTLIAGHVVADRSKGEVAMVAQEISAMGADDQASTLRLIQVLGFTLLEMFTKQSHRIQSPRVTETVLWFNARWIPVYLLVPTTPLLSSHFSGVTGQEMLQYLLIRLQEAVVIWKADADVVLQVAAVIKALTLSEGVMHILLGLDQFQSGVKVITEGLDGLPAKTHGPLISAIVGCIYSSASTQSPEIFFDYIKQAIEARLSQVIHQPNFASSHVSQRADTIASLLSALDMLDGLAASVQPRSAAAVYAFVSRFFPTLVSLAQLYHERNEVVTSIVRVYCTLTSSLDLGFGAEAHMVTGLNVAVSSLLNVVDEKSLLGDNADMALEETIPFEGLTLVMQLLGDLMLASDNDTADARQWFEPLSAERTSDVCLQGFSRLTPLLNNEAQSVVRVQRRFSNLTNKLWICFPHRILGILVASAHSGEGAALFHSCVSALTISLGFVETSLIADCFDAIRSLSNATERVYSMAPAGSATKNVVPVVGDALMSVLTTVLRGVLVDPLATSLLDAHLLSVRTVLQSLASSRMGGIDGLQARLAHFCASTSLGSETGSLVPRRDGSGLRPEEEAQKRSNLNDVVVQLASLAFEAQQTSSLSAQARQDEAHFLKQARRVAWDGRAKIRAG